MMKQVGIGIAGMGFVARVHSRALAGIPEARIAAVWSKFPEEHQRYREFAAKSGFEVGGYYTDLKKMLGDPKVEAVICAIPYRFIEPIAEEIVGAGKPMLIECPPAETPEGIGRLEKLAKKSSVKVMPGHCYRFAPAFKKSKELLEKGEVGAPVLAHFREFVPAESLARQWKPGSWVWDKEKGGPIPTMTVFSMDMARWLLGSEPVSMYSTLKWQELSKFGTVGYTLANVIKFKNDVSWVSEFSGSVAPSMNLMNMQILGENGNAVEVDGPQRVILHREQKEEQREWSLELARPERWGHKPQDEYFIKSVLLGGEEPAVTLQDAMKAMEMSLAIIESSKTGKTVEFGWG